MRLPRLKKTLDRDADLTYTLLGVVCLALGFGILLVSMAVPGTGVGQKIGWTLVILGVAFLGSVGM